MKVPPGGYLPSSNGSSSCCRAQHRRQLTFFLNCIRRLHHAHGGDLEMRQSLCVFELHPPVQGLFILSYPALLCASTGGSLLVGRLRTVGTIAKPPSRPRTYVPRVQQPAGQPVERAHPVQVTSHARCRSGVAGRPWCSGCAHSTDR